MSYRSIPRWIILSLLGVATILPVMACVILVLSALLGAMGDATGARVLVYVGWAVGVLWCVSLIALVFVLALQALFEPDERSERLSDERRNWPDEPGE